MQLAEQRGPEALADEYVRAAGSRTGEDLFDLWLGWLLVPTPVDDSFLRYM